MRAENLRFWTEAAIQEESPDPTHWEKVVGLIQAAFCKGRLAEECSWKTVVLIPKGNEDFQ